MTRALIASQVKAGASGAWVSHLDSVEKPRKTRISHRFQNLAKKHWHIFPILIFYHFSPSGIFNLKNLKVRPRCSTSSKPLSSGVLHCQSSNESDNFEVLRIFWLQFLELNEANEANEDRSCIWTSPRSRRILRLRNASDLRALRTCHLPNKRSPNISKHHCIASYRIISQMHFLLQAAIIASLEGNVGSFLCLDMAFQNRLDLSMSLQPYPAVPKQFWATIKCQHPATTIQACRWVHVSAPVDEQTEEFSSTHLWSSLWPWQYHAKKDPQPVSP